MGARMPAAVIAATEIEPMARCSTAAISQARTTATRAGVPCSAEKKPPSTSASAVSPMTAPREPPTPVTSRIWPVVFRPSFSASLVRLVPSAPRASR